MGLIDREQLIHLLQSRQFYKTPAQALKMRNKVGYVDLDSKSGAGDDDDAALDVTKADYEMFVDVSPHVDEGAITVHRDSELYRVFRMFSSLGLRHLIVTDERRHVAGIITRKVGGGWWVVVTCPDSCTSAVLRLGWPHSSRAC